MLWLYNMPNKSKDVKQNIYFALSWKVPSQLHLALETRSCTGNKGHFTDYSDFVMYKEQQTIISTGMHPDIKTVFSFNLSWNYIRRFHPK